MLRSTGAFGDTVEHLLRKHGKLIVNEQVHMKRIADCAIDLFGMTATISRASSSLSINSPGADHEEKLTRYFCSMASQRIKDNLNMFRKHEKQDALLAEIAGDVFKAKKYIPSHPTGVNC